MTRCTLLFTIYYRPAGVVPPWPGLMEINVGRKSLTPLLQFRSEHSFKSHAKCSRTGKREAWADLIPKGCDLCWKVKGGSKTTDRVHVFSIRILLASTDLTDRFMMNTRSVNHLLEDQTIKFVCVSNFVSTLMAKMNTEASA